MGDNKIVSKEETKPCGCHVTEYSDGTGVLDPCVPCGLAGVARGLKMAADAMMSIAARIRTENQQAQIMAAIARSQKKT